MKISKGGAISIFVIFFVLADQIIKFAVKLNMTIGESVPVFGHWFRILFIENNGMAFGLQWGGVFGKLLLSVLRLALIAFIIYFIVKKLLRDPATPKGVFIGVSLVLVGAIGNELDSIFYGVLFDESTYSHIAGLLPAAGGYAPLLCGRVVDMFYFPIIDTVLPDWVPFWGGEPFVFFRPVFNLADACISVGFLYLLFFQSKFLFSKGR
ncbi:MAG: lipoprotein signal peptidase [Bacteroidales bacterium]|jgi:signal peptidase II|nr:lipoprotein signal peptidase [Bacteroidales bacterium]